MDKIRIGNDIQIIWSLYRDGIAEDFNGKKIDVFLKGIRGKIRIDNFKIEDNQISFIFFACNQKWLGNYDIMLILNNGTPEMSTIDHCEAFSLVDHTCKESLDAPREITLESEFLLARVIGESAYDIAVRKGFVGTEDEWLGSLDQPAREAAERADEFVKGAQIEVGNLKDGVDAKVTEWEKAETKRVQDDAERDRKEVIRIENDEQHERNETERDRKEEIRIENDEQHERNEDVRKQSETERQAAEIVRVENDEQHERNETERNRNELIRIENDERHERNETTRQNNESDRAQRFDTAMNQIEQATTAATDAGILADEKAGLAGSAATLAAEKAEEANKQAQKAKEAGETTAKIGAELDDRIAQLETGKLNKPANVGQSGQAPILQPDGSVLWSDVATEGGSQGVDTVLSFGAGINRVDTYGDRIIVQAKKAGTTNMDVMIYDMSGDLLLKKETAIYNAGNNNYRSAYGNGYYYISSGSSSKSILRISESGETLLGGDGSYYSALFFDKFNNQIIKYDGYVYDYISSFDENLNLIAKIAGKLTKIIESENPEYLYAIKSGVLGKLDRLTLEFTSLGIAGDFKDAVLADSGVLFALVGNGVYGLDYIVLNLQTNAIAFTRDLSIYWGTNLFSGRNVSLIQKKSNKIPLIINSTGGNVIELKSAFTYSHGILHTFNNFYEHGFLTYSSRWACDNADKIVYQANDFNLVISNRL